MIFRVIRKESKISSVNQRSSRERKQKFVKKKTTIPRLQAKLRSSVNMNHFCRSLQRNTCTKDRLVEFSEVLRVPHYFFKIIFRSTRKNGLNQAWQLDEKEFRFRDRVRHRIDTENTINHRVPKLNKKRDRGISVAKIRAPLLEKTHTKREQERTSRTKRLSLHWNRVVSFALLCSRVHAHRAVYPGTDRSVSRPSPSFYAMSSAYYAISTVRESSILYTYVYIHGLLYDRTHNRAKGIAEVRYVTSYQNKKVFYTNYRSVIFPPLDHRGNSWIRNVFLSYFSHIYPS